MHRAAIVTLMTLSCLVPDDTAAQTLWLCGLSADAVRLVCVAEGDPSRPTEASPQQTAVVNGTVFPLDPRRQYVVDLWSPPTEMDFVEHLARSTICYRSPGCSVVVADAPWAARSTVPAKLNSMRR